MQHSANANIEAGSSSRISLEFNLTRPVRYVLNGTFQAQMFGSADLVFGYVYFWRQNNELIFKQDVWSEDVELAQMGPLQPDAYSLSIAVEASIHSQYSPPLAAGDASFEFNLLFQTPGDANGDGVVNVSDLLMVINQWGHCGSAACASDMAPWPSGDNVIDVADLLAVINNWG